MVLQQELEPGAKKVTPWGGGNHTAKQGSPGGLPRCPRGKWGPGRGGFCKGESRNHFVVTIYVTDDRAPEALVISDGHQTCACPWEQPQKGG